MLAFSSGDSLPLLVARQKISSLERLLAVLYMTFEQRLRTVIRFVTPGPISLNHHAAQGGALTFDVQRA